MLMIFLFAKIMFLLTLYIRHGKIILRKKAATNDSLFVGVARLERATACTPCKNASRLHHTPKFRSANIQFF